MPLFQRAYMLCRHSSLIFMRPWEENNFPKKGLQREKILPQTNPRENISPFPYSIIHTFFPTPTVIL